MSRPSEWREALDCWHQRWCYTNRDESQVDALRQGEYPALGLWVALHDEQIDAVIWVWPEPGGYAYVWPLRLRSGLQDDLKTRCAAQLWAAVERHYRAQGTRLFQILVPVTQDIDLDIVKLLGFKQVALIVRHQIALDTIRQVKDLHLVRLEPCENTRKAEFDRVIIESLTGSLDVPELNALQSLDEATAQYHKPAYERYFICHLYHGIIGGLVLQVDGTDGLLRYIGLTPAARRQGLASLAMHHSLGILKEKGCLTAELRVDARNTPALHLYGKMGFRLMTQEHMMLYP